MNTNAVLESVSRCRTIASLFRQTAGFRPLQGTSLVSQAQEWERLAVETLEAYFADRNKSQERALPVGSCFSMQSEMMAAAT